jgi:hypothetical protein
LDLRNTVDLLVGVRELMRVQPARLRRVTAG